MPLNDLSSSTRPVEVREFRFPDNGQVAWTRYVKQVSESPESDKIDQLKCLRYIGFIIIRQLSLCVLSCRVGYHDFYASTATVSQKSSLPFYSGDASPA